MSWARLAERRLLWISNIYAKAQEKPEAARWESGERKVQAKGTTSGMRKKSAVCLELSESGKCKSG